MRAYISIGLVGSLILAVGCERAGHKFALTVRLEQPQQAVNPLFLLVDLTNVTAETHRVIVPTTNYFWGIVYWRSINGQTNVFAHTNMLDRVMGASVSEPFDLAP